MRREKRSLDHAYTSVILATATSMSIEMTQGFFNTGPCTFRDMDEYALVFMRNHTCLLSASIAAASKLLSHTCLPFESL